MKRIMAIVVSLVLCSQSITQVPAQTFTLTIWIERGCGAEYHVGEMLKVHWEASHSCTITIYEEEPDGKRRKLTTQGIIAGAGHGSRGWTIEDYGYGRRVIHATATSEFGSDSDSCEYYVVQEDEDKDGVPDDQDNCYNPGCTIVDSQGCPRDSDGDGINDCDDNCPHEYGERSNNGCPTSVTDTPLPPTTTPAPTPPPIPELVYAALVIGLIAMVIVAKMIIMKGRPAGKIKEKPEGFSKK